MTQATWETVGSSVTTFVAGLVHELAPLGEFSRKGIRKLGRMVVDAVRQAMYAEKQGGSGFVARSLPTDNRQWAGVPDAEMVAVCVEAAEPTPYHNRDGYGEPATADLTPDYASVPTVLAEPVAVPVPSPEPAALPEPAPETTEPAKPKRVRKAAPAKATATKDAKPRKATKKVAAHAVKASDDVASEPDLNALNVPALRALAKAKGHKGYSRLTKPALIALLSA